MRTVMLEQDSKKNTPSYSVHILGPSILFLQEDTQLINIV